MKEENNNRDKWLHVRLTVEEHTAINKGFKSTTETKLSDYVRKVILGKPMIASVRNQSLQDILAELQQLRKDLNGTANNFNQAVKKLHTLKDLSAIDQWLIGFRLDERRLLSSIETMKDYINKTAQKWLQE